MVVQHNLTAMNSNRMLGITQNMQAKASEKLASGYRINRAADDAAGLAISEKMRKQINGLDQASTNAQDGVSAVQTAEGALTEVHSMLQRMNELAVQAANGTNSDSDRDAIQAEIDQLVTEIDRVAETTKFNETYLLKGDAISGEKTVAFYDADYTTGAADLYAEGGDDKLTAETLKEAIYAGKKIYLTASANQSSESVATIGKDYAYVTQLYDANGKALTALELESNGDNVFTSANSDAAITIDATTAKDFITTATVNSDLAFNLHVGADSTSTNKIGIRIEHMSAKGIGVNGLDVTSEENATDAVSTIAQAIQKVSDQRSALGAVQNRLEHTIANLDNVVENTTAAESRIRDTDMAEEMVEYSKNNILAQAGQSMLAQANQATSGVMSILQG